MLFKPTVVQLQGVDGQLYDLTAENYGGAAIMLRPGAKGLDAPNYDVKTDEYPGLDGGFIRHARASIREIFLPLVITAKTRPEMMALKRRFINSLNPRKGLVTLQTTEFLNPANLGPNAPLASMVAEPTRSIQCFYSGGMEGGEGNSDGVHWASYGLILRAPVPYFYGQATTAAVVPVYEEVTTMGILNPLATPLANPGDIEAQPRWEIRGPAASRMKLLLLTPQTVVLKELRFAEVFTMTATEVLIIETAKSSQSIRLYPEVSPTGVYDPAGGKSMYWALDTNSPMWAMEPGANRVGLFIERPPNLTNPQINTWRLTNAPKAYVSYQPAYQGI